MSETNDSVPEVDANEPAPSSPLEISPSINALDDSKYGPSPDDLTALPPSAGPADPSASAPVTVAAAGPQVISDPTPVEKEFVRNPVLEASMNAKAAAAKDQPQRSDPANSVVAVEQLIQEKSGSSSDDVEPAVVAHPFDPNRRTPNFNAIESKSDTQSSGGSGTEAKPTDSEALRGQSLKPTCLFAVSAASIPSAVPLVPQQNSVETKVGGPTKTVNVCNNAGSLEVPWLMLLPVLSQLATMVLVGICRIVSTVENTKARASSIGSAILGWFGLIAVGMSAMSTRLATEWELSTGFVKETLHGMPTPTPVVLDSRATKCDRFWARIEHMLLRLARFAVHMLAIPSIRAGILLFVVGMTLFDTCYSMTQTIMVGGPTAGIAIWIGQLWIVVTSIFQLAMLTFFTALEIVWFLLVLCGCAVGFLCLFSSAMLIARALQSPARPPSLSIKL
jgi:hypothetical protein